MDFGIFILMQQRNKHKTSHQILRDAVEQTRLADELGFGGAWFAEHHFSNYGMCSSPLTMIAHCADELGPPDILVNVAGGTKRQFLSEASRADIARDIQRNYGYVVQSVQRAVPLIKRSGQGGSIISFTTIEAHRGAASFSVYAGAKAATTNFTRAMAVELGKDKIRVSCIAPDTTLSQGNVAAMPPSFAQGFMQLPPHVRGKGMAMYIPRREQPPVDALADAVLFLGSDLSTFVSGMTLHVDGGTMAAAGFLDWPFGDGFVPTPLAGTLGRMYREGDDA